jgi:hypothetical protein
MGAASDSTDRALPADWSTLRGRDAYLAENGFTVAAYDEPWTEASFLGIDFVIPNTPRHAALIRLHDLHHVATGYGTDLAGEGEISAWELRRGLGGLGLYVGSIVVAGALMGLLIAPRRALRAWSRAAEDAAKGSLFQASDAYEELLAGTVGDLRARLGVPPEGVAEGARGRHRNAPQATEQSSRHDGSGMRRRAASATR